MCAVALAAGASAWGEGGFARGAAAGGSLTIYSSMPEQGGLRDQARAIENGAALALSDIGGKVGSYRIRYRRLDSSLARTGAADEGRGRRNARKAAHDATAIGYIGEFNSYVSRVTIPILNRAGMAQISPSNTFVGLTSGAPGHMRGEPKKYYPTGRRTYARVIPNDTVQGAALATTTRDHGCASVHLFNSGTPYSRGLTQTIKRTAHRIGLKIEGSDRYDPQAQNYKSLARHVKAPCVIQTGEIEENGVRLLKDVAAADRRAALYAADALCLNASKDPSRGIPPSLAPRFKCTIAALDPRAFGPRGRHFFARFAKRYHQSHPDPYAIYGYESMALMLDSIKRASAGGGQVTRKRVVAALFSTRKRASVLGTYSIDRNGDTTLRDYGLYKIVRRKWLAFDRVIRAR